MRRLPYVAFALAAAFVLWRALQQGWVDQLVPADAAPVIRGALLAWLGTREAGRAYMLSRVNLIVVMITVLMVMPS